MDVISIISIVLGSNLINSVVTWFISKRKYNTEVDKNLIQNMQEAFEFYQNLSEDNKSRLNEVLKRNEELEKRDELLESEIRELKKQMFNMMSTICTDLSCQLRKNKKEDLDGAGIKKNI